MQYDPSQLRVINAQRGCNLVLAAPGCGKTQILAERICRARALGVAFDDMLCLTFTNRAARGMHERIKQKMDDPEVERLFVGNVHRYCSRFLFDNAIVPAESAMIDDDDIISILANYIQEDEYYVASNAARRREYFAVVHLAGMMFQIEHAHPRELRIHPECLSLDDVTALRMLCEKMHAEFTPERMLDVFEHVDVYRNMLQTDGFSYYEQKVIVPMLRKMELAAYYRRYKRENSLLDFNDLLLLTYQAMADDAPRLYRRFRWIQVDEVQDLNPLQLRIVDLLTDATVEPTVLYLGDEQQAIFSFMGAKMSTLEMLKQRCGANVFGLEVNHRSPDYLLELFNAYAERQLGIPRHMLPTTNFSPKRQGNELAMFSSNTYEVECREVVQQAERLSHSDPTATTAILVTSNAEADHISAIMDREFQIPHFRVSGTDLFSTAEMKLLLSHVEVLAHEYNFLAWSRLLKGLRVYEQGAAARTFVRQLKDCAMLPSDLLRDDESTYILDFLKTYDERDIVVFDTETTGLDVFHDDIVQIAALRLRRGRVVEGSEFKVFIATDRHIPEMLGTVENPIIEEMRHATLLPHDVALRQFVEYAEGAVLLGHNADYDYNILRCNLQRYLPQVDFDSLFPQYFDTLKLCHLLMPELRQYKLRHLLEVLHLEGENSHLADADVEATKNVVLHCHRKALDIAPHQQKLLASRSVNDRAAVLRRNYKAVYDDAQQRLNLPVADAQAPRSLMVEEMERFYRSLTDGGFLAQNIPNIDYIFAYIDQQLLDFPACVERGENLSLKQQVSNHVIDVTTMRESDLCGCSFLRERIYITTIHKAKGLEFDNVIIFDAVEGRFPAFYSNTPLQVAEDARKLYVAMTRARRCLYIATCAMKNVRNRPIMQQITPFLRPHLKFFGSVM